MDKSSKRSVRLTGTDRTKLAADVKRRYDSGESIRSLASSTGRSYGFIHRILSEGGVSLRGRGGATRGKMRKRGSSGKTAEERPTATSLSVSIFLDTEDQGVIEQVLLTVDEIVDFLGYQDRTEIKYEHGSFIQQSRAKIKAFFYSPEVSDRAIKFERALELATLDIKQAEVDKRAGEVAAGLIEALKDVPNACIRAGSTVLIKYAVDGTPVIRSRQLSQLEIRAWEKYPEIQNEPSKFLETLALAVESIQTPRSDSD